MSRSARLVEDRLRRRAERGTLGEEDELLELGVETGLGLDEVVDEPHGELAGGDPTLSSAYE